MTSTQVAYVKQSAASLTVMVPLSSSPTRLDVMYSTPIPADFDQKNCQNVDFIFFYIQNNTICQSLLQTTTRLQCKIQFSVKHHYFSSLHKSIENLSPSVLSKLMPRPEDLKFTLREVKYLPKPHTDKLDLDHEYQFIALKKIMGCSPNGLQS